MFEGEAPSADHQVAEKVASVEVQHTPSVAHQPDINLTFSDQLKTPKAGRLWVPPAQVPFAAIIVVYSGAESVSRVARRATCEALDAVPRLSTMVDRCEGRKPDRAA